MVDPRIDLNFQPTFLQLKNFKYPTPEQVENSRYILAIAIPVPSEGDEYYRCTVCLTPRIAGPNTLFWASLAPVCDIKEMLKAYVKRRLQVRIRIENDQRHYPWSDFFPDLLD